VARAFPYREVRSLPELVTSFKEVLLYPNSTTSTRYLKNLPASGCKYLLLDATGRTLCNGYLHANLGDSSS
jgi:hypothetical protein